MKINDQDKLKIVTLAKQGQDANTIRQVFKQYTRQQLAAIIAWVTMGKFGGTKKTQPLTARFKGVATADCPQPKSVKPSAAPKRQVLTEVRVTKVYHTCAA